MTTESVVAIVLALAAACCGAVGDAGPSPLTASVASAPAEIRADCELASRKCTRCHTLDRVLSAPASEPSYWRVYVRRMRLNPGSGIRADEEPAILRCLLYHSFGAAAVEEAMGKR